MTETLRPRVLRAEARESLKGKWGKSALACLVYMLLVGAISMATIFIPFAGPFLAQIFVTNLIAMGAVFIWLDVARGKDVDMNTFFEPFRGHNYGRYLVGGLLYTIYVFLWSLLLVVPGIIKAISYSQAYFIMRDNPEMTGEQAICRSMEMMRGHKAEYFCLLLSFIGWIILGSLALGIGLLWVYPYIFTASAKFYENLKKRHVAAPKAHKE